MRHSCTYIHVRGEKVFKSMRCCASLTHPAGKGGLWLWLLLLLDKTFLSCQLYYLPPIARTNNSIVCFFFFFFSTSFFFFCSSSLQISFPQNQPNPKTATFFHHILSNFTQPKASILSRIILLLLKKTCVSCIFCLLFFLILTYRRMLLRKLAAQFVVWFLSTFFILFTIQHKKRTLVLLPSFPYISGLKK